MVPANILQKNKEHKEKELNKPPMLGIAVCTTDDQDGRIKPTSAGYCIMISIALCCFILFLIVFLTKPEEDENAPVDDVPLDEVEID